PYLPSFNFSISRALFERAGGFDEHFLGAAGEDVDLSLRLAGAGHALYFEPAARVTHRPARVSPQAMARHLRTFGRAYYGVQRRQPSSTRSALAYVPSSFAGLIIALSPVLACKDIVLLLRHSRELRRFPHAFWGMVWGRTAWYWGVVEALLARSSAVASAPGTPSSIPPPYVR
ncbi:MAG TPA: glycosyltransferase family 2 protein, partial [Roseiflexaceae bacterium]